MALGPTGLVPELAAYLSRPTVLRRHRVVRVALGGGPGGGPAGPRDGLAAVEAAIGLEALGPAFGELQLAERAARVVDRVHRWPMLLVVDAASGDGAEVAALVQAMQRSPGRGRLILVGPAPIADDATPERPGPAPTPEPPEAPHASTPARADADDLASTLAEVDRLVAAGRWTHGQRLCGQLCRRRGVRGAAIPPAVRLRLAACALDRGRLGAARHHARAARQAFEGQHLGDRVAGALVLEAAIVAATGALDDARTLLRQARASAGLVTARARRAVDVAELTLDSRRGAVAETRRRAAALTRQRDGESPPLRAAMDLELALLEVDDGRPSEARAPIDDLLATVRSAGPWAWRAWVVLAQVTADDGDVGRARRLVAVARQRLHRAGDVAWWCRAVRVEADLAEAAGDATPSYQALLDAHRIAERFRLGPEGWALDLALARRDLEGQRPQLARRRIDEVGRAAHAAGAHGLVLDAGDLAVRLCLHQDLLAEAERALARNRQLATHLGAERAQAEARALSAVLHFRTGHDRLALRWAREVVAAPPRWAHVRAVADRLLVAVRDPDSPAPRAAPPAAAGLGPREHAWWADAVAGLARRNDPAYEFVTRNQRKALSAADARNLDRTVFDLFLDAETGALRLWGSEHDLGGRPRTVAVLTLLLDRPDGLTAAELVHGAWHEAFDEARHGARIRKAVGRLRALLGTGRDGDRVLRVREGRYSLAGIARCGLLRRLVPADPELNPRQTWILAELARSGRTSNRELCQHFDVHRETARRDFGQLVARGLIDRHGGGPATSYRPAPPSARTDAGRRG